MSIQVLNNSQLSCFRGCPHQWGLHYVQKLIAKITRIDARCWGSLYHCGQEGLWEGKTIKAAMENAAKFAESLDQDLAHAQHTGEQETDEARDDLVTASDEVKWAIKNYAHHMRRELDEWIILGIEYNFRVIVSRGVHHEGTIDLIAYDPIHERIVIVDHKSTSEKVDTFEGRLQLDTQHVGYTYAVRDMIDRGIIKLEDVDLKEVSDVFQWHVVRRKVPSIPKINKMNKKEAILPDQIEMLAEQKETGVSCGSVSTAAIDTLPILYEEALQEQVEVRGIPTTEKQDELMEKLRRKGDGFFGMTETFVPEDRIARWKHDFLIDAKRIREAYRDPTMRTRNPSSCSTPMSYKCDYRDICIEPMATNGYIMDSDIIDPMQERKP